MTNTLRIYRSQQTELLDEHFSGSPEHLRAAYETALERYDHYENQPLLNLVRGSRGIRVSRGSKGTQTCSRPNGLAGTRC